MAGGEPRFGTTATYMRRHDHRATCLSIEIDRLHDRLHNEYQVFSAASVRKWSKFGLERLGRRPREDIGLAVECRAQTVDALVLQDGGEFGAAGRHLADRAVEVYVGDQPSIAGAAHHIVDIDRLTIRFDDLAAHHGAGGGGLLAGYLQFLSVVAVKAVGVDRRDIAPEALRHLLPLGLGQSGPG